MARTEETPSQSGPPRREHGAERAIAPIRWPHPDKRSWALLGLWVAGMFVAVFVPALIVPPGAVSPPTGEVWLAFSVTVLGALMMITSAFGFWRRYHDHSIAVFGGVPAAAVLFGGLIIVTTKLTGG